LPPTLNDNTLLHRVHYISSTHQQVAVSEDENHFCGTESAETREIKSNEKIKFYLHLRNSKYERVIKEKEGR
jgi:hypothetical protein